MPTDPPIRYRILPDFGVIHVTVSGTIDTADVMRYVSDLSADPRHETGMRELIDVRGLEDYDIDAAGMTAVVSQDRVVQKSDWIPRCALVGDRDRVYGLLRMYQLMSEASGTEVQVFRDMSEALRWLDLPADFLGGE